MKEINGLDSTVSLAQALIQCRSVAPDDDGAQAILKSRLKAAGFSIHDVPCQGRNNFWAEIGESGPLLAFAVHTDVVPEGSLEEWSVDPFEGTVRDGHLIGRGAVDMKSQISCVITALENFLAQSEVAGFRLGVFVTGDEEPEGNYGANAILDFLESRGTRIDYCLVTEPTSQDTFGDTVKIGRRGSIHGSVRVFGRQMHSSLPDRHLNPVFTSLPVLRQLSEISWCRGNDFFPETVFQFTRIHADGGATNTTPAELQFDFNLRFSTELTAGMIQERVESILRESGLRHESRWSCNAHPFLTEPGLFTELVRNVVKEESGIEPQLSTGGGTSDGRFIAARGTALVEFGFVGRMCHMVDEMAPLSDIDRLRRVYQKVLSVFAEKSDTLENRSTGSMSRSHHAK